MQRPPDDPVALDEYAPLGSVALTDAERWPGLSPQGRARLGALVWHPLAPRWVHATGHRLSPERQRRAVETGASSPRPDWLQEHLARARVLPHYRDAAPERLEDFPFLTRDDLVRDVSAFVPRDADLDQMLHGTSSGSTGAALVMPDDPDELARWFHHLVGLVRGLGVDWRPAPDRLGLAYLVNQRQAFTYASVLPGFGESAMARLNLAETDPDLLAGVDPQVLSGDPTALDALLRAEYATRLRPLAIVSSAMALTLPLRAALEAAFGCPVLDVYGLHETRPIAVSVDGGPHVVLDRRVHVEVLRPDGSACADGERGEIVVTAGENRFLPLVRYRTGDTACAVRTPGGRMALAGLEGRARVTFRRGDGARVPSVDLTQQLQAAGCRGWAVVQSADGSVAVRIAGGDGNQVRRALGVLLDVPVEVARVAALADLGEGKPRRFRSEA
ncbi:CoF synthetase [Microbacterium sp. JZ31]|uniref:CoF synthetase n=1 Tax=Microbacterium sp. JZ31 TaxID=1906274 RepID=UPI001933391C|nr:CoF synthetase [Microbacterium sp. JZ31]